MAVYLLKHPETGFSGVMGGVDFSNGRGSTSSLADVRAFLLRDGFSATDAEGRPIVVEARLHPDAHIELLTAKVAPLGPESETIKGEGASAPSPDPIAETQAQARAALKAVEDNPDSAWSKERAMADAKKKRGGRRRK